MHRTWLFFALVGAGTLVFAVGLLLSLISFNTVSNCPYIRFVANYKRIISFRRITLVRSHSTRIQRLVVDHGQVRHGALRRLHTGHPRLPPLAVDARVDAERTTLDSTCATALVTSTRRGPLVAIGLVGRVDVYASRRRGSSNNNAVDVAASRRPQNGATFVQVVVCLLELGVRSLFHHRAARDRGARLPCRISARHSIEQ